MRTKFKLDSVFTPNGQPSVTYVRRSSVDLDNELLRLLDQPNYIVSLTGPSKSGKTVLCRKNVENRPHIIIEGGQIDSEDDLWLKTCHEVKLPSSIIDTTDKKSDTHFKAEASAGVSAIASFMFNLKASISSSLEKGERNQKTLIHGDNVISRVIEYLIETKTALIIDDFHYIDQDIRARFLKRIKGPSFNGLKVVLISVPHRTYDAIKAEPELTGRVRSLVIPPWEKEELRLIPTEGFNALNVSAEDDLVDNLCSEAENSPLLMQSFCRDICYDNKISETKDVAQKLDRTLMQKIYKRIAQDNGEPTYIRLSSGPATRTDRVDRPLKNGGSVDIYKALLMAIAETGPKQVITYEEIRSALNTLLSSRIPQRHEVTNTIKHLSKISNEIQSGEKPIDFDETSWRIFVPDPYFRFYLRWHDKTSSN